MNNNIWIIGDTHFYHSNIIKYCNRPFKDIEEMNKILIEKWNNTVKKQDTVIVAGDFALCGKDKIIEIGNKLHGRKTLILGNHDQASVKTYYEAGFEIVSKHPIVFDNFAIISHEPLFTNSNSPYVNIFAHVHNDNNYKDVSSCGFCVSAERINYRPVSYEEIKRKIIEEMNKI